MSNYWTTKSGRVVKETSRATFNHAVYVYGESVAGGWCGQLRLERLRPATPLEIDGEVTGTRKRIDETEAAIGAALRNTCKAMRQ